MSPYLEIASKIAAIFNSPERWIEDHSPRAEKAQRVVNDIHEDMAEGCSKEELADAASWWACFYERQCCHQSGILTDVMIWALDKELNSKKPDES